MLFANDSTHLISLFILFIIVSTNYSVDMLPCKFKLILKFNYVTKHFFLFLTLLFTIFLNHYSGFKSLRSIIYTSVFVYIWFLILINLNLYFMFIIVILLLIRIVINKIIDFDIAHMEINRKMIFINSTKIIDKMIIILTVIGFIYSISYNDFNISDIYSKDLKCPV